MRGIAISIQRLTWVALCACLLTGCVPPSMTAQGTTPGSDPALAAQLSTLNERLGQFDTDNRELHTQVAQLQQTLQLSDKENKLLRQQLADASTQLEQVEVAKQQVAQQLTTLQASVQSRGGATITANNSLKSRLQVIEVPGVEVRLDGDVVRIEIPSDRLFAPGTTQMQTSGMAMLDQIGEAVRRHYPRQMIAIEGHTDSMTGSRSVVTAQQLTATQALAVFHRLTGRGVLAPQQLFTMGMGANRPRFSNGEAAGRSRNRRIELVIYPETYDAT